MSYVGGAPAKSLASPTSQYFNGDGSTTVFTLNRPVNVSEELEVFVNNIQQEPGVGKSYTANGTSLTFDAAPSAGTANVYVVYRGLAEVTTRLEHNPNAALVATTGTFSGAVSISGGISNLIRIQTFNADGTYTKSSGVTKALVYVVGGGGGGGGVDGQGAGNTGVGGGGGAGGMAMKLITSGLGDTETVTVGSGGGGGSGSGGAGGSTAGSSSFGSHCSATGGSGGNGQTASSPSNIGIRAGGDGGVGSNGDINTKGQPGQPGIGGGTSTNESIGGAGGMSIFGGGAKGKQGDSNGEDCDDLTQAGSGGGGAGGPQPYPGGYAGGSGIVILRYKFQ